MTIRYHSIAILLLTFSFPSLSAPGLQTGKVVKLEFGPTYGNVIYVDIEGSRANRPNCVVNGAGYDYAFDSESAVGGKIFSALLAAQRAGAEVIIAGGDQCFPTGGVETLLWMQSR
ncbi:hypothetical protein V4V48_000423 [Vibrio mimicus]